MRPPSRLTLRPHRRHRLSVIDAMAIPVDAGLEAVGDSNMDTEVGEPVPALMTQHPTVGAVHHTPPAVTTRIPHPQVSRRGQPQPPLQPPRVEPTQLSNG